MNSASQKSKESAVLEKGLPVTRNISSTYRNKNFDPKKPPLTNHVLLKTNEASPTGRTALSPNTKRKIFRNRTNKRQNNPIEGLTSMIRGRSVDSSSVAVESETQSSDIATSSMRSSRQLSDIRHFTGSYEIYSIQSRPLRSAAAKEDKSINIKENIRNPHIKQIRRGIPSAVSSNVRRRSMSLSPEELTFSEFCICRKGANKRRSAVAWIFSIATAFLCVLFPILSFSADVSFFLMCRPHYNETIKLLNYVNKYNNEDEVSKYPKPKHKGKHFDPGHTLSKERHHPAPHRSGRAAIWFKENVENKKLSDIAENHAVKRAIRHERSSFISTLSKANALGRQNPTQSFTAVSTQPTTRSSDSIPQSQSSGCIISFEKRKRICSNQSYLLEYMSTREAARQLKAHKHVTTDVYEPVFILGSFPSLVLCIFTRLIVMTTKHNHFLSAYFINVVSMPLQLITGALAVHSASFHVGQNGFECWKCALKENCSVTNPLQWLESDVSISLIVTTIAKFLDGAAGGCILFVVLLRIMWVKPGHVSCWWYVGRGIATMASFTFCLTVSAIMVLTPSLGVFRLEMLGKTAYFPGKEIICYLSMVLLIIGLTAWGATFLFLLIYCIYRTHVFCRISEHLTVAM